MFWRSDEREFQKVFESEGIMQYEKFRQYLVAKGNNLVFVNQCLRRAGVVENAYGRSIDELVQDDATMYQALKDLEWKIRALRA